MREAYRVKDLKPPPKLLGLAPYRDMVRALLIPRRSARPIPLRSSRRRRKWMYAGPTRSGGGRTGNGRR